MIWMILAVVNCSIFIFAVIFALVEAVRAIMEVSSDTEWEKVRVELHLDNKYRYLYDEVKRGK